MSSKTYRDKPDRTDVPDTTKVSSMVGSRVSAERVETSLPAERADELTETRAELERLRSELGRYRELFRGIDQGFCVAEVVTDPDGRPTDYRYVDASPAFEQHSGLSDVIGKTYSEIVPDADPSWLETLGKVISTGHPVRVERRVESLGKWFDVYLFRFGEPADRQVAALFSDITVRKRTEDALRESEERFRRVANAAPVGIWVSDTSNHRYWFNRSWLDFTGRTAEEEYGAGWMTGVHPDDREKVIETCRSAFEGRSEFEAEYRLCHASGEYRWVMDRGIPLIGPGDDFSGYIGSCADVSERRQAEQALRESEDRFSRFMRHLPGLAWIKDTEGRYLYANDAAARAFRTPVNELLGKTDDQVFDPEEAARFRENDRRAIDENTGVQTVESLEHDDGLVHQSIVSKFPIPEADGRPRSIGGIAIDITERIRAEEALRASQAEIETIFTGTPFMLTHCTRELRYRYVSRSYAAMFGLEPEQLIDVPIVDIIGQEALDSVRHRIDRVLAGESCEYQDEVPFAGIGPRYVRVAYVPVRDPEGTVTGWVASIIDLTDRREAEYILDRYRLMSEHSRDIIWFSTPEGRFVNVNRAAVATYGYSPEEFLAMNIRDVRHPSTHGELAEQLSEANRRGIHFETLHIRKDGTSFPVEVAASGADLSGERLIMSIVRDITQRKENERELFESEERRKLAEDAGNVGIWDWDIVRGQTYWSETMWAFYGEKPADINPDEAFWSSHLHEDDRERVKQHIRRVARSADEEYRDEFRIVREDGSVRWIDTRAKVLRDGGGRAVRMLGVNLDVTLRKADEERLRFSENQLRLVTDTVPALISYIDAGQRYRFVNQKYCEWFATGSASLVGKRVREVVGTRAYRDLKPYIDEALLGRQQTFETELHLKGAGNRFVRVSYTPDVGPGGAVLGFYELVSDLTDLKRSEDLLRSSEEKTGLMMESLVDYAILGIDIHGRIDTWNKGAELIFGYSHDEAIGMTGEQLFTPEDIVRDVPSKEMRTARQKGRAVDERWHIRKDGTRFFASGVMIPIYVGGALSGYAKIASDLTERQRNAEALQRAHDELEMRVAERTNELALANAALLQEMEERKAGEDQRVYLLQKLVTSQESERRRIARDLHDQLGQRLTALRLKIASLKDISAHDKLIGPRVQRLQEIAERLDAEVSFLAWELRPSALDDLGLVDAVGTFVSEWSRHYEIPAEFHAGKILKERLNPEVETHLYRITQEALNNIAKHADATHVTVLLENRETSLVLIVEDNGRGFDPAVEGVPRESGKGLGLVGMRERASLVDGDIEIESAPGSGTTIYVRIRDFG